jgi:hypothetical protein
MLSNKNQNACELKNYKLISKLDSISLGHKNRMAGMDRATEGYFAADGQLYLLGGAKDVPAASLRKGG